jgi:hypothetical protein
MKQAVEKGSPASDCPEQGRRVRSIASLQRIDKHASARRFLARLASETFLNSLTHFSTLWKDLILSSLLL